MIPLGEPVLVLLVLTPVSQRAVRQCGHVVGACACFVDLEAVVVGGVWVNLPSVPGMPQFPPGTAPERVSRALRRNLPY